MSGMEKFFYDGVGIMTYVIEAEELSMKFLGFSTVLSLPMASGILGRAPIMKTFFGF